MFALKCNSILVNSAQGALLINVRSSGAASFSGRAQARPVPKGSQAPIASSSLQDYCILDLNGHQQIVEEGSVFAAGRSILPAETMPGGKIRFDKVVAARQGDTFVRGAPYVSEMCVEAELVEEFSLTAPHDSLDRRGSIAVGKVLVTKIRHTAQSQRVLQEMLNQQ